MSRKAGRGQNINKDTFEGLCRIFCTQEEILAVLNVSYETLRSWVKQEYNGARTEDVMKDIRETGKASLRRLQLKHAEKNVTMAIWLGKQYLGQKDQIEEVSHEQIEFISDIPKL